MQVLLLKSVNDENEECRYQNELQLSGIDCAVINSLEFDLNVVALQVMLENNENLEAFMFTSKVAVKVFGDLTNMNERWLDLPCFSVGRGTGDKLRYLGFTDIRGEESGNLNDLLAFVSSDLQQGSHVLWPCGSLSKLDVSCENITLMPVICYSTKKTSDFDNQLDEVFSQKKIEITIPFSPSICTALQDWIYKSAITSKLPVVAMGPTTAAKVKELANLELVGVAAKPSPVDLVNCLKSFSK